MSGAENENDDKTHRTPNWDLFKSLNKRIGSFRETTINPQWAKDNKSFWYRADNGGEDGDFIIVDVEKRERRLAFDHDKLIEDLKKKKQEHPKGKLPFAAIDPVDGGKIIRFRTGVEKWQVDEEGKLASFDGDLDGATLVPLDKEVKSDTYGDSCSIVFLNNSSKPVQLLWIDYEERPRPWLKIEPGKSDRRISYNGHVWRIEDPETKKPIVSFQAIDVDSVAMIEEYMRSDDYQRMRHCRGAYINVPIDRGCGLNHVFPHMDLKRPYSFKFFTREHNAWMMDADGKETRLSRKGTKAMKWDTDPSYSPNGRYAVEWHYKPKQDHRVHYIEYKPSDQLQPKHKDVDYLKAGQDCRKDKPRMFDLLKKKEIKFDDSLYSNPYDMWNWDWNEDGTEYRFGYNERGHKMIRIISLHVTGKVRVVFEESSKTFVDYSNKKTFTPLEKTDEQIWMSERDGRNHLYLYNLKTGTLTNQITKGEYVVHKIDRVDSEKRQLWFEVMGYVKGRDPYYIQLARINFNGSGLTILTDGNGNHTWNWSPDHKYLTSTHSRIDLPPETVLRDASTGQILLQLEEQTLSPILQSSWTLPERFAAPGRDNKTLIYGLIIRPSNMDPKKKYAIIEHIYAGPHEFHVPKSFALQSSQHTLSELGFIVVMIDGMGTNWREKSFHDVCHKNLKDAGFPDRIAWMKAAAKTRPWMDLSRVGVTGGSAGGQNALAALLWHGDFYKAAAANNGCHDNRIDKQWWSEAWMGWPVDESYAESSNVVHAHKLRGKLLLIVGELDGNVDPACTMQVVAALNEAEKDYELLFQPGAGHCEETAYVSRRIRDFFVRELMGGEVPNRNAAD